MNRLWFAILLCLSASEIQLPAETVKDREGAVRKDKAQWESDARWIYNDVDAGFRQAAKTGKPLLVVLRCVPCLACAGIDSGVLEEKELVPLLDQFICVRIINANALDLTRFQFDYDLSFSAMCFHGDGTVYARYGSWKHQKEPANRTLAGLAHTLQAALDLHRGYPANRSSLKEKQANPLPFRTPVEFPELSGKYRRTLDWNGPVVASCVHCHMIGEAIRDYARTKNEAVPQEWIYPHPSFTTTGATLGPEPTPTVAHVARDSPAADGGLMAGDQLLRIDGQPILSEADASWALHRAPGEGSLLLLVNREGKEKELRLQLPTDWRHKSDISQRSGTWQMRAMALGGMVLEELDAAGRATHNIPPAKMALRVGHVGKYGIHAVAHKAGFLSGDLIVAVDHDDRSLSESALIGRLLQKHRPGSSVEFRLQRGPEILTLNVIQQ